MPSSEPKLLLFLAVTVWLLPFIASADQPAEPETRLPNIVVLGSGAESPGLDLVAPRQTAAAPVADGAELLRQVTGVSAGRMGGHGLEPVIRGQSQGRLNVLLDGAHVFGACPNRMDPPTSFVAVETWDQVTILKGVQTLRYGTAGSGGTILFERFTDAPDDGFDGVLTAAATSNGRDYEYAGDVTWGAGPFYARGMVQRTDADNYDDGNGDEVRSAFDQTAGSLVLGLAPDEDQRFELSADFSRTDDALYPGAGMDSPKDDVDTYRMRYKRGPLGDWISGSELEVYYSDVDHLMDNYSNRVQTAPMAMRVPADSETVGARWLLDLQPGAGWEMTVGVDYLESELDATRYQGMTAADVTTVNSYLWPDVSTSRIGGLVELARPVADGRLKAGLRLDHVEASADRADADPPAEALLSANELYRAYYGRTAGDENEDNISGLLRYEREIPGAGTTVFAGLSRTMRTADGTERYIASNHPMDPRQRWVGNPGLDPEDHRQADLGFASGGERWGVSGVVFYDDVKDFILRDRARAQDGIRLADGASIYRNVDAELFGAELEIDYRWAPGWLVNMSAAYVHGDNTDDDQALYQIPPLNGVLLVQHERDRWHAGARLRWAAKQRRADDDPATGSGLDARETPGYGVVDLYGRMQFERFGELSLGVDNVFDKNYADHLNRGNRDPFNPDPIQINEPGLTAWANWRFQL